MCDQTLYINFNGAFVSSLSLISFFYILPSILLLREFFSCFITKVAAHCMWETKCCWLYHRLFILSITLQPLSAMNTLQSWSDTHHHKVHSQIEWIYAERWSHIDIRRNYDKFNDFNISLPICCCCCCSNIDCFTPRFGSIVRIESRYF